MIPPRPRGAAGYLRFLARALGVGVGIAALCYLPTLRLAGSGGVRAMFAGSAVAWIASAVGGLPLALAGARAASRGLGSGAAAANGQGTPQAIVAGPTAILLAMALRLFIVVALGLAAATSGFFEVPSLVLWTAIGYVAQLAVDSHYAITTAGTGSATAPGPGKAEVESE